MAETPLTPTLSLVLSHKVISEGAPTAMNCSAPLTTPSFITLGPATLTQFSLTSPSPAALACFSTNLSRSITIRGRKLTPYCWATFTSGDSAAAGGRIASSNNADRRCLDGNMLDPPKLRMRGTYPTRLAIVPYRPAKGPPSARATGRLGLPRQAIEVEVAAAQDHPHSQTLDRELLLEQTRERHGTRWLNDEPQLLPQEPHRVHDRLLGSGADRVHAGADDSKGLVPERRPQTVRDGARVRLRHDPPGAKRLKGIVGPGGLGAIDLDRAFESLGDDRGPGEQSAATHW